MGRGTPYGVEAVSPIEVEVGSLRVKFASIKENGYKNVWNSKSWTGFEMRPKGK